MGAVAGEVSDAHVDVVAPQGCSSKVSFAGTRRLGAKLRSHEPLRLAMEVSTLTGIDGQGRVRGGWAVGVRKTTNTVP